MTYVCDGLEWIPAERVLHRARLLLQGLSHLCVGAGVVCGLLRDLQT